MKILVLCYEYPPIGGGGGRMAHQIAAALAKRGHTVRVHTARLEGETETFTVRDGVDIVRHRSFRKHADHCSVAEMAGYLMGSALPAFRDARRWKPDVVHAHFAVPSGVLAYALHRTLSLPYVLTCHLGDLPGGNPDQTDHLFRMLNPFIKPIWNHAAAVSASSTFARDLAREAYGIEAEVILNGVRMEGAGCAAKAGGPLQLTAAGRFNPQKNFPWMIRALALVPTSVPWRLTLVGDGPERASIERAIHENRLEDRITLAGWVPAETLNDLLAGTDLFLMPSTSEGNPVAAIEAVKRGAALLTSDIPGLQDLVEEGQNGFRISLSEPAAFAERVARLARDSALLEAFRQQSVIVAKKFDLETISDRFEALLQRAAER